MLKDHEIANTAAAMRLITSAMRRKNLPRDRDTLRDTVEGICSSIACRAKSNSYARGPAKRPRLPDSVTLREVIGVYKQSELERGKFLNPTCVLNRSGFINSL